MLDKASFSTQLLKQICPVRDKFKIKFASVTHNITGWMKAPKRTYMHKIQSLEDYIVSQTFFKHILAMIILACVK